MSNRIIQYDSYECTLEEFIEANTAEDVGQLDEEDINALIDLQVGQSYYLAVHAGYTEIKRVK